jgi:UDP-N-acetylglucosamine 2-epimerase (non-hydrolysing)
LATALCAAIHMVGNVMIDTLDAMLAKSQSSSILERTVLRPGAFFLATLHRPTNVDHLDQLERVVDILVAVPDTSRWSSSWTRGRRR